MLRISPIVPSAIISLILLKKGNLMAEVDMRTASREEVKEKLSIIYGDIELLQHGSGYLMGKA